MIDLYYCPSCRHDFTSANSTCPRCEHSDAYVVDEEYLSDSDGKPHRMKDGSPMLKQHFCNDPDGTFYDLSETVGDPQKGEFRQHDRVRISDTAGEAAAADVKGRTGTFVRYYLPKREAVVMVEGVEGRLILPPHCLERFAREEADNV